MRRPVTPRTSLGRARQPRRRDILLLGNPTQLSGTFYDAFHGKAEAW